MADQRLDPDAYVGYALVQVAHVLERRFTAAVREAGLTPRQFSVLALLEEGPALSVGALARRVLIAPQSMGELLDGLAAKGLVERLAPAGRGRPAGARVTDRGRDALARAAPHVAELERQATDGLEPAAVAQLRAHLALVLANVRDG
jgi:DNA-binding MarR family transcriptional regulator